MKDNQQGNDRLRFRQPAFDARNQLFARVMAMELLDLQWFALPGATLVAREPTQCVLIQQGTLRIGGILDHGRGVARGQELLPQAGHLLETLFPKHCEGVVRRSLIG